MIVHSKRLVYIDRHAGGEVTPELAAAGRAKAPGLQGVLARDQERARRHVLPLGDLVERWAKPVAVMIDRATSKLPAKWRTGLAWCGACSGRQARLNGWVGDVRSTAAWVGAVQGACKVAARCLSGRR